jgi:hypothetical protein
LHETNPRYRPPHQTSIEGWDNYASASRYYLNRIGAVGINKCPKKKSTALYFIQEKTFPCCSGASNSFRQWRTFPNSLAYICNGNALQISIKQESLHDDHCRL